MKTANCVCLVATLAVAFAATGRDFRLLSYNVRHCSGADDRVDCARTAAAIMKERPDFVGLQEVDVRTTRSKGIDQPQALSRLTGMHATFARAIDYKGGEYGVAVLSKEKPLSVVREPLPGPEPRVLLLCEFTNCWFGTTHLDSGICKGDTTPAHILSVPIISNAVAKCASGGKPVFLTGDWNATPGTKLVGKMEGFLKILNDKTVLTTHDGKMIDYVTVDAAHSGRIEVKESHVTPDTETSDHKPVSVVVGTREDENLSAWVEGEQAVLPAYNAKISGWRAGYRPMGVRLWEVSARRSLQPETLKIVAADGRELKSSSDYAVHPEYGAVGLLGAAATNLAINPVTMSYAHRLERIDAWYVDAEGKEGFAKGVPAVRPAIPALPRGARLVETRWVRGGGLPDDGRVFKNEGAFVPPPVPVPAEKAIPRTLAKLRAGKPVKIVAWGDSVTLGEYLPQDESWPERVAALLQARYPKSKITLVRLGWNGSTAQKWITAPSGSQYNYAEKVLTQNADLVVTEFVNESRMKTAEIESIYGRILADFRERGMEWVVFTPHYIAPDWMGMKSAAECDNDPREYVRALRGFAVRNSVGLADASARWGHLWREGVPYPVLLVNGLNHPDATGQGFYVDAFQHFLESRKESPSESSKGDQLEFSFRSPQGAERANTGPLFWLHGTETEARLREYVGRVAESGNGILTIESRPHKDWMREGWWRDVDIVLDECRKRGIKMKIFDDYWYPSQCMGGKYPIPEKFQCVDVKGVVYPSADAPRGRVPGEICRVAAEETEDGAFRICPNGSKMIVYSTAPLEKDSPNWYRHPTVNGLDEEAVDWFLASYYKPYFDRYRTDFENGTIQGFFFDEPQFRSWWGPALKKELETRGEDVGELLTALKFSLADPETQARAFYRYMDARAEAWGRTMYGRQSDWCAKHGVYSSGHFWEHASCYYSPVQACGNVMQQMKYVTVPGVDLVCNQLYPEQRENVEKQINLGQMPKYASSAAHVYNRHGGLNWSETFGAYGQDLTYPQMKWLCDWHHYQGCHYLIPHSFNPKAPEDRDCPPYFYNGGFEPRYPLYRVWADYNNRCAMMLSGGGHVCRIAQCVPGMSFHVGRTIRPEMFSFAIQDAQLDSDWMGYDAVESATIAKDPRTGRPSLRTENGTEHYDILSLPATEYVPFATLEKALAFAKAGGVVVGYGIKPCNTPTRGKTADDAKGVVEAIFAQPTALFIDGEPDGAKLRAALSKSYPGEKRPLAVRELEFVGLSADDARMLALCHCAKDGREIFFIANQDCKCRRDIAVKTRWPAADAELWDPMQGTVERPLVDGGLVKISLEPGQAMFLVWPVEVGARSHTRANHLEHVADQKCGTIPVVVEESVTPMVAGDADEARMVSLENAKWIWHPVDPEAGGKVTFRMKFKIPKAETAKITFSCDNAAAVCINGKQVAEQKSGYGWRTPTTAEFALKAGMNEVEVLAENSKPGPAGFVAAIGWSGGRFLTNSKHWEVFREGEVPVRAGVVCAYGKAPWGRLERVTRSPYRESVATRCAFTLPKFKDGERVFFVCDGTEGENSAAVTVNGAFAGGFIGAPFRLDITQFAKAGANTLEAKPFRLKNPRVETISNAEARR